MTQTARPDGTTSNTWNVIDSTAHGALSDQSDSTYISRASGTAGTAYGTLQDVTDPLSSTGHTIKIRVERDSGTGSTTIRLYQGDPGTSGTQIATFNATATTGVQEQSYTLTGTEADSITNYSDLFWYANKSGGTHFSHLVEYWFEIPDANPVLSINNAAHAHAAENATLTPAGELFIQNALHAHTAERPAVYVPASKPTMVIELDTGGLLNGARLNDAPTAQLDSAILEYVTPLYANDITGYVRDASTSRGAQRELQRVEAGTAHLTLDNLDGRFTPFNISSPYYPNILPMRRIRIQAQWQGELYPIFQGFVEGWPIVFPEDKDMVSNLTLVDGFKVLSQTLVSGNFPQQGSGSRVAAILSAASWPAPESSIDSGVVTVPAITLGNVPALQHIQDIAHAEGGRFFMARDGKATFKARTAQVNPDLTGKIWADDGTGMSYRDITLVFDDELILNDIHITRVSGTEQVATDVVSQNTYGIRSSAETDVQLVSDGDAQALAELLVARYSDAALRIEGLVDNAMQHQLWERVLIRELDDIVVASESRTAISQVSTMEGLAHEIGQDGSWTVILKLSPTTIVQAGVLDDATYGLLDSTAILA